MALTPDSPSLAPPVRRRIGRGLAWAAIGSGVAGLVSFVMALDASMANDQNRYFLIPVVLLALGLVCAIASLRALPSGAKGHDLAVVSVTVATMCTALVSAIFVLMLVALSQDD